VKADGAKGGRKVNTVKSIQNETKIVEQSTNHLSHPHADLDWVNREVWTERMLNTLRKSGAQGSKWHSLIDKVYRSSNLNSAYKRVAANKGAPGVDGITIERYGQMLPHAHEKLSQELRSGDYTPHPVKRVYIDKPGSSDKRPLGLPCVRERVVQTALKQVVEPIFEATFHPWSFGFRPGVGCKDALREVNRSLKEGYCHVVDADIKSYFDQIDRALLMDRLREHIADGPLLDLFEKFLQQGVMENMHYWETEKGTPQGAVISPLLANIFLNPFDWLMNHHGIRCIRYADDFVLLCRTRSEAETALQIAREWMSSQKLTLHPEKTRLVDMNTASAEFTFLGYTFKRINDRKGHPQLIRQASEKALRKLRQTLREPTRRCNGHSLPEIIAKVNQILRGWYGYFKQSHGFILRNVDGYVRRRLRRILRKRSKRQGGTGKCLEDHKRWPNVFFDQLGLFSLKQARHRELQSLRGTH
jgi:RNA-directed DNA polymerase